MKSLGTWLLLFLFIGYVALIYACCYGGKEVRTTERFPFVTLVPARGQESSDQNAFKTTFAEAPMAEKFGQASETITTYGPPIWSAPVWSAPVVTSGPFYGSTVWYPPAVTYPPIVNPSEVIVERPTYVLPPPVIVRRPFFSALMP